MCWLDCLSLNWVEPGDSPSRLVGKGVHPQYRRQSPPQDWLGVQVGQGPQRLPNEDISELIKQAARFYHLAQTPWSPAALPAVSGDPAGMPSSRRHHLPKEEAPSAAQKQSSIHRSTDVSPASFNTGLGGSHESSPARGRWAMLGGTWTWHKPQSCHSRQQL